MSAILPPAERVWWNQPIDKLEFTWIAISLVWALTMFVMMIWWHLKGDQNLANETYRTTPDVYMSKAQAVVDKYTVRTDATDQQTPVVAPPAGSDIYLVARLWSWWPIYELEHGKTYKLHLSSMDYMHGFSLQPQNINIEVHPKYDHVIKITPNLAGTYSIVCNEYCGINHHTMAGRIYVK